MDAQEGTVRGDKRRTRRQPSDFRPSRMANVDWHDHRHRFSEPKTKLNLIKINKSKLPVDFFQNKQRIVDKYSVASRLPAEDLHRAGFGFKKAESERMHYSPQKTSYFGCFDESECNTPAKITSTNLYNRHFQTRQEPKRIAFPIEPSRKLATAAKNHKNQFIDMAPPTERLKFDQSLQLSQKGAHLKMSPRKESASRGRQVVQPLMDPQKSTRLQDSLGQLVNASKCLKPNQATLMKLSKQQQMLNITFFKGKSTSFPPINRI